MSLPIRVLVAGPSLELGGGVANYNRLLLKYIDASQVSFSYVAVRQKSLHSSIWRRPFEYLVSILNFVRAIRYTHYDLVHINSGLTLRSLPLTLCLLIVARVLGQRTLLFFRGWDNNAALAMIEGTWKGRTLKRLLGGADYYLVLAESFRQQLTLAGWQPERVGVSPVMVEVNMFQRDFPCEEQVSGLSLKEPFRVLFLSRLYRDKGVWELIGAVEWFRRTHPGMPVEFIFAGNGPELDTLQVYVQTVGLDPVAKFLGHVHGEKKHAAYHSADLFVFPSYHDEGFPNVIVEALAAGLPIVYTPVGALSDVLGDENGIRIELSDLSGEMLGRRIWELLSDRERCRKISTVNRKMALDYDAATVCMQMISTYQRVIGQKRDQA